MEDTKFLFRFHRTHLDDSMKTVCEFSSYEDLLEYVKDACKHFNKPIEALEFEHCCYDSRIGWDTWYVCTKGMGGVIGMTNANPLVAHKTKEKSKFNIMQFKGRS